MNNLYFIVEGKSTERKVYPKLLEFFSPNYKKVDTLDDINKNNYYLFSSQGYPSIYDDTKYAIKDINNYNKNNKNNKIIYLILCIDAEEMSKDDKIREINANLSDINLYKCDLKIIIQNKCIESWFLGNKKIFKRNPQDDELKKFINFYNVYSNDPENMDKIDDFKSSIASFHKLYLKKLLKERNQRYSEKIPYYVIENQYINCLKERINKDHHLKSLKYFIEFCDEINNNICTTIINSKNSIKSNKLKNISSKK
jgi:hypothetical protein